MTRSSRCQNATKAPEKRGGTGGGAKLASWPRLDTAGGQSATLERGEGGRWACAPARLQLQAGLHDILPVIRA